MTGRSLDLAPRCEHKPGCGCDEWYWMGQALSVIANLAIAAKDDPAFGSRKAALNAILLVGAIHMPEEAPDA